MSGDRRRFLLEILGLLVVVGLIIVYGVRRSGGPHRIEDTRLLMGTVVTVTAFTDDEKAGRDAISAAFDEMARVDRLTSRYDPASALVWLNGDAQRAGGAPVDPELLRVIARTLEIARASGGAFDPTVGPLMDVWPLTAGMSLPGPDAVAAAVARVGYVRVVADTAKGTITLPADSEIDLSAIAKGYAVGRAIAVLKRPGIDAAIVDAGGDIGLLGTPPHDGSWRIGVKHPRSDGVLGVLTVDGGSVATSGDYQRYVMIAGKRYHHILDPSTGYPAGGVVSVTITSANAADADALATAVFVMGAERGMKLVEALPGVEAVIVTGGEDLGQILVSSGLKESFVESR